ncbi:uncharacterized protein LOC129591255 [Paramacrobiotus metropolitanus]|uniref:uncharacterized protein LOC129591255 n=1 Tax=Paramacrobiotus metropolitanus TaxID=2943436 RepID=UPI0024461397|nr:uncharacterized protein LOC129591255 [Paramacrobiotus metropolitanus]
MWRNTLFSIVCAFLVICLAVQTQGVSASSQCNGILSCPAAVLSAIGVGTGEYCCYATADTISAYCCTFSDYIQNRTGLSLGAIIGIVVGVAVGFIVLWILLCCCCGWCCFRTTRYSRTRTYIN